MTESILIEYFASHLVWIGTRCLDMKNLITILYGIFGPRSTEQHCYQNLYTGGFAMKRWGWPQEPSKPTCHYIPSPRSTATNHHAQEKGWRGRMLKEVRPRWRTNHRDPSCCLFKSAPPKPEPKRKKTPTKKERRYPKEKVKSQWWQVLE